MAKLNQIIAVNKTVRADTNRVVTDAYHVLQKGPLLTGLTRVYRPRGEDGEQLPGEASRVQVRVPEVMDTVKAALVKLFDLTATLDTTNQVAKADIVLADGTILVERVPVSTLLFVEKQLVDIRTLVMKLPLLDPAEIWSESTEEGVWSADPVFTVRTKKIPRNHVKAEATDKHPAQVELYYEDVVVGDWTTMKFSGAVPQKEVKAMLARVSELTEAVKQAREHANNTPVVDCKVGEPILSYVFFGAAPAS